MNLKLLILLLLLFQLNYIYCQNIKIKGKVVDNDNKGIPFVNIYSIGKLHVGTISNEDGNFVLNIKKDTDSLIFSHINYKTNLVSIKNNSSFLNITMKVINYPIKEVVVKPIKAYEIMDKVFSNLKKNHEIEPVYYKFFTRNVNFTSDSVVNLLEEHSGIIFHKKTHNSEIKLDKSRLAYFSEAGKKMYNDYRMIFMGMMMSDNVFKFLEDYLHKRKSKKYNYKYTADATIMDRLCYVINFSTDKSTYYKKGTLYVDKETYAIVKKVLFSSEGDFEKVTFTLIKGKWYLKNASYFRERTYFQQRTTIYNVIEYKGTNDEFKRLGLLMPEKTRKLTDKFNDEFWEDNNFIPLPDWIKLQVEKGKSR